MPVSCVRISPICGRPETHLSAFLGPNGLYGPYRLVDQAIYEHPARELLALEDGRGAVRAITRQGNSTLYVYDTLADARASFRTTLYDTTDPETGRPYTSHR